MGPTSAVSFGALRSGLGEQEWVGGFAFPGYIPCPGYKVMEAGVEQEDTTREFAVELAQRAAAAAKLARVAELQARRVFTRATAVADECEDAGAPTRSLDNARKVPVLAQAGKRDEDVPVSLCCPLSGERMGEPCLGPRCTHLQCFDGAAYRRCLRSNAFRRPPLCPVCGSVAQPADLQVHEPTKAALERTKAMQGAWQDGHTDSFSPRQAAWELRVPDGLYSPEGQVPPRWTVPWSGFGDSP